MHALGRRVLGGLLIAALTVADVAVATEPPRETPDAAAVVTDMFVARTLGSAVTVAGAALFLATLPFTFLAGREIVDTAAQSLVMRPYAYTVDRPLGYIEGWEREDSLTTNPASAAMTTPPANY